MQRMAEFMEQRPRIVIAQKAGSPLAKLQTFTTMGR
jgi:hypothetical protein